MATVSLQHMNFKAAALSLPETGRTLKTLYSAEETPVEADDSYLF